MPLPEFANQETPGDLLRLKNLLQGAIADVGTEVSAGADKKLLNLACGRADEMGVLAEVFGKQGIHLTGLDIRDREIGEAQERWGKHLPANADAEFLVQDCSKLGNLTELDEGFDLAFMRHQNFWNGDTTWSQIYDQALHRLSEDGHLVITSYFDREHHLALDAIQSLGAELILNERNPNSRILTDAPGKSVDRHIAIFKKP